MKGCIGAAAWKIKRLKKVVTVMWHVPSTCTSYVSKTGKSIVIEIRKPCYPFRNWMGVGIWDKKEFELHGMAKIFKLMWRGKGTSFKRKEFLNDLNTSGE